MEQIKLYWGKLVSWVAGHPVMVSGLLVLLTVLLLLKGCGS